MIGAIGGGRGESGGAWRRFAMVQAAAGHLEGGNRAGEWRHVWHKALRASNGLAITFGRGERVAGSEEIIYGKHVPSPEEVPGDFIPCFLRTRCYNRPGSGINFGGDGGHCGRARRRSVSVDRQPYSVRRTT